MSSIQAGINLAIKPLEPHPKQRSTLHGSLRRIPPPCCPTTGNSNASKSKPQASLLLQKTDGTSATFDDELVNLPNGMLAPAKGLFVSPGSRCDAEGYSFHLLPYSSPRLRTLWVSPYRTPRGLRSDVVRQSSLGTALEEPSLRQSANQCLAFGR